MQMTKSNVTRLLAVAGFAAAGSTFAATPDEQSGAPAGYQGIGLRDVQVAPFDAFNGAATPGSGPFAMPDTVTNPAPTGQGLGALDRTAVVQAETTGELTKQQQGLVAQIDAAWQTGDFETGRDFMAQLDATGFDGSLTYAYTDTDIQPSGKAFDDVFAGERRIGGARIGIVSFDLDSAPNDNLFAVTGWGDTWTFNISTNGGSTWHETFTFGANSPDVDLAYINGFVYVGYSSAGEGRMRRFDPATGAVDGGYFFHTVFTPGVGDSVAEIAVESNEDNFQNRIYWTCLTANGIIEYFFDDSADGTTFGTVSTGIVDGVGPLDFHWNQDFTNGSTPFLVMSHRNAAGDAVVTANTGAWASTVVASATGVGNDVNISAYQDTIIVAYETAPAPADAIYHISYNGGTSYNIGTGIFPAPSLNYFNLDVSAALGYGTAMIAGEEVGEPDPVRFVQRPTYAPGAWPNQVGNTNQTDLQTGNDMVIEALPIGGSVTARYGVIHVTNDGGTFPVFDRVEDTAGCIGDIADDFGFLGSDGMVSFGDFLALLGLIGPCPGGIPGCTGDIADDFGFLGGDGMVSFGDFLALLGLIGPCP